MKIQITVLVIVIFFLVSCSFFTKEKKMELPEEGGLIIHDFTENSPLERAGAKRKDILWKYDGKIVSSVEHLGKLKEEVKSDMVQVEIIHYDEHKVVSIPSGKIGVYLLPIVKESTIDKDAQIIEGIGKLQWGNDQDISFFGALAEIEKLRGQNLTYNDLLVLSGYGYRTNFYDGWCPSSPDATCGFNCGEEIMKKLGYEIEFLYLEDMMEQDKEFTLETHSWKEIKQQITASIDSGFPVLAIDLIQVPEWGLITGYQKNGDELFCRTYFDRTEGYDLVQKKPWVLIRIHGKKEVDIAPLYNQSLKLAAKLYNTPQFENYTNGINATETWISHLKNEDHIISQDAQQFQGISHANSWIYYALSDSRKKTATYLANNKSMFTVDENILSQISELYTQEAEILEKGLPYTASIMKTNTPETWTTEMRARQVLTLQEYHNLELKVKQLLNSLFTDNKLK